MPINNNRVRVLGSAYTVFAWRRENSFKPIAYAREVAHRSPQPVAQSVAIHPLNWTRPAEIATPRAIGHGELTLTVYELYGRRPWEHLAGLSRCHDLADVFHVMKQNNQKNVQLLKIIRPPARPGAALNVAANSPSGSTEVIAYKGVKIVDIREDDTVRIDAMENSLTITLWYARQQRTRAGGNSNGPLLTDRIGGQ